MNRIDCTRLFFIATNHYLAYHKPHVDVLQKSLSHFSRDPAIDRAVGACASDGRRVVGRLAYARF